MANTLKNIIGIGSTLGQKDLEILTLLYQTKVLFSSQINILFYNDSANEKAGLRCTNRKMKELRERGLVEIKNMRIPEHKVGSSSYIWHLTDTGYRLVSNYLLDGRTRPRYTEPGYFGLCHKLSVAETYVQIVQLARNTDKGLRIVEVEFEPNCWRDYHQSNNSVKLKPDLFLATKMNGYEFRYFIEMDLGTEAVGEIIRKCDRYHAYLNTNKEQDTFGVFPAVLWIVPDENRKEKLIQAIKKEYESRYHIFLVITPEELETTILNDLDQSKLI